MSVCLFIRSYERDFEWLAYALRSIQKFATGFCEVIVAVPEGQAERLRHLTAETIITVHDGKPGYLCQQADKLNADLHTRADFIVTMDSDCIFTRPVTPSYFFKNGKPSWTITPFDEAGEDQKKTWLHIIVKCVRQMPAFEFMRRNCLIVPRHIYGEFRGFVERTHGMSMQDYVMSQPGNEFSEWNCLGFYAYIYHREAFHWHDTSIDGVPDWPFIQRWSWGGLTEEIRDEFELLLA